MQCWKIFEKRIGARLGGERVGILGGEDVRHPTLSIECTQVDKARFPKMVKNKYLQAIKNAPKGKMPNKAVRTQAEAVVLKSILEVRDLLIFIYQEISGKVDASGRPPS